MARFTFNKEEALGHSLGEEQYVLLSRLIELDLSDYRTQRYEKPLIQKRLQEIAGERKDLGLDEHTTAFVEADAAVEAAEEGRRADAGMAE
jgi:hypothetical protein